MAALISCVRAWARRWVHYVPVRRDLSDLKEKVRWLQEHDEEAERIGLNAAAWARDALSPAAIDAYTEALIRGAAAREAVELSAPASDDELIYKSGAVGQYVHLNGTDHKGRRLDVHCPASEAAQELLEVSDARTLARQYFESANAALEVARRGGNLRRYKRPN